MSKPKPETFRELDPQGSRHEGRLYPENRSRDCLLFRRIRARIAERFYESRQVLEEIANRLPTGGKNGEGRT